MKCEQCGKDSETVWAFNTTSDGVNLQEHDCCSENCATKRISELEAKGYESHRNGN